VKSLKKIKSKQEIYYDVGITYSSNNIFYTSIVFNNTSAHNYKYDQAKRRKGIRLITADLKNNDIQSARNNLVSSKIWLDAAIMECNGESYEIFMDYKTRLLPKVENILKDME